MKTVFHTVFVAWLFLIAPATWAQNPESKSRVRELVDTVQRIFDIVTTEPEPGRFHVLLFDAARLPEHFHDKRGPSPWGR